MMVEVRPVRPSGYVDPGWDHGTAQDEKKKKVKCNYCGKVVSGGIYRLKQHLARVSGEVTYCDKAPEDVYLKMKEILESCRSNKKPRLSENDEQGYLNCQSPDDEDNGDNDVGDTIGTKCNRRKDKGVVNHKNMVSDLTPLRPVGFVDPGWEYGVAQDDKKKKVMCNFCGKIVSGGINRFKQHLARIPGEVAPCKKAPDEVFTKMKEHMKWHRSGKRHKKCNDKGSPSFFIHSDNEFEDNEPGEDTIHHFIKDRVVVGDKKILDDFRMNTGGMFAGSCSETYLKKSRLNPTILKTSMSSMPLAYKQGSPVSNKRNRMEVVSAICEFFYYAGVPMQAADSLSFQKMLELVGQYGPGLKPPSSRQISGRFLQDELLTLKKYLAEYRTCWTVTGCSIMADSWVNTLGRSRINFLVSCPRGVYFLSSVDVTDLVDDHLSLFKLLDRIVDEVGEENVVQVVTPNTESYKAAGKMLEAKRRSLFWTPCAVYCIDKVLEDLSKLKVVGECFEKAQKLTRFIYNRAYLVNFMKKEFTGGQDLLRPAITKYTASFLSLEGVFDHRIDLRRMFQSSKWLLCRCSKSDEGKAVEKIVMSASFWKKMMYVQRSVDPILHVLQNIDVYGYMSMPYIYNDLHQAKLAIKSCNGDDVHRYGPFWNAIDKHCSALFCHPLCLAAYCLNPAYRYQPDYQANPELARGLNECIVRLEPNGRRRVSASMQISDFISAKADFGTELAVSTRTQLDPAVWWRQHGVNCLELQYLAERILSQSCSAFGCEHNWSTHDQMYCQRSNRTAQKKLNDLVCAHYNLRLRERQINQASELISLDSVLLEGLLDDWVVEAENHSMQDGEDILDTEDGYDYTEFEYDNGRLDIRRGTQDMLTPAQVEPFEVHPYIGPATDDDPDFHIFDDDMSD